MELYEKTGSERIPSSSSISLFMELFNSLLFFCVVGRENSRFMEWGKNELEQWEPVISALGRGEFEEEPFGGWQQLCCHFLNNI